MKPVIRITYEIVPVGDKFAVTRKTGHGKAKFTGHFCDKRLDAEAIIVGNQQTDSDYAERIGAVLEFICK